MELNSRFMAVVLVAIGLMVALTAAARAQGFEDALAGFAADSFSDTEEAIGAVASSGNPRALAVIQALQDGRLMFSADTRKVFIKDPSDQVVDAATGQPAASPVPADLEPVRINNRLRRAIEAALGGLSLLASDPAKRLEAAQRVFKSREA